MDFGQLDDILDEDIGYIPTGLKKQTNRPKSRGGIGSLSRQNSTKSINSNEQQKKQDFSTTNFLSSAKDNKPFPNTPNNKSSLNNGFNSTEKQILPSSNSRRSTLFGAHKQTAINEGRKQSIGGQPTTFEDFFKNQASPSPNGPSSRPPLPEKKFQKTPSLNNLGSPEDIINDDELNNSSVASRRGRPPMRKGANQHNPNQMQNNSETPFLNNNRSEHFASYNNKSRDDTNFNNPSSRYNPVEVPIFNKTNQNQQGLEGTLGAPQNFKGHSVSNETLNQLKQTLNQQLEFQKNSMENLIKQERQSHQKELEQIKVLHSEEMQKKLQLKDFELSKQKQFYELQIKLLKQRQNQIRQYSSLNRKLESNIQSIEKMEKQIYDKERSYTQEKKSNKEEQIAYQMEELKRRSENLQNDLRKLSDREESFSREKSQLLSSVEQQKQRLYDLQISLRKKQSELQVKYKKKERQLEKEYETKSEEMEKKISQNLRQMLEIQEQRNQLSVEKQQLTNQKKLFENEKKTTMESIHQEKVKNMQHEIQLASKSNEIEVKAQEIEMAQKEHLNRLKLLELDRKKMDIERKSFKGQLFNTSTGIGLGSTQNLKGAELENLKRQFYSKDYSEFEENNQANETSTFRKSVTQMRDEFLKSMPKF